MAGPGLAPGLQPLDLVFFSSLSLFIIDSPHRRIFALWEPVLS